MRPDYVDKEVWSELMNSYLQGTYSVDLRFAKVSKMSNRRPLFNLKAPIFPPEEKKYSSYNEFIKTQESAHSTMEEFSQNIPSVNDRRAKMVSDCCIG